MVTGFIFVGLFDRDGGEVIEEEVVVAEEGGCVAEEEDEDEDGDGDSRTLRLCS
jgi:hypothetical protein